MNFGSTPKSASQEPTRLTLVLVHGTFACAAPWTAAESALRSVLSAAFGADVVFHVFGWSGKNTQRAREQAARSLSGELIGLRSRFGSAQRIVVIGHSHGGIVACAALSDPCARRAVAGVICLGTAFLRCHQRRVLSLEHAAKLAVAARRAAGTSALAVVVAATALETPDMFDMLQAWPGQVHDYWFWPVIVATIFVAASAALVARLVEPQREPQWPTPRRSAAMVRRLASIEHRATVERFHFPDMQHTPMAVLAVAADEAAAWLAWVSRAARRVASAWLTSVRFVSYGYVVWTTMKIFGLVVDGKHHGWLPHLANAFATVADGAFGLVLVAWMVLHILGLMLPALNVAGYGPELWRAALWSHFYHDPIPGSGRIVMHRRYESTRSRSRWAWRHREMPYSRLVIDDLPSAVRACVDACDRARGSIFDRAQGLPGKLSEANVSRWSGGGSNP